jgi:nucleoside-diphosphate-sugar epimerase
VATALITGVQGFTGRYLAQALRAAGYAVVGLGQAVPDGTEAGRVLRQDLLDRAGLIEVVASVNPQVVVHLAGIAFVAHGDADAIYRTNVVGTRNLLEALVKCGCKPRAVLLASSANVYGNALVSDLIEEATPAAPANDYAVSKLAMEHMASLWKAQLPITIVRPFNYTGVGQAASFLLPKIVDHFRRRAPVIELGNLDVVRDFSDVRSVVERYRLLLQAESAGETFNVCSGRGYALSDVLHIMREISGFEPEIRVNPAFVRANEVHRLVGSQAKLDSLIGPVPNIPLHDTLKWMLDSAA